MTVTALGLPTLRRRPDGAVLDADAPTAGPLVDTYGRIATDLRVSLTDRCNLRCTYCMPAEGLDWLPTDQLLRPDELTRLLRIAVTRLGITSVRFTGGSRCWRGTSKRWWPPRRVCGPARDRADHQRPGIGAAGTGARRSRPGPGQCVAGHR
ncbi:molybdenum cofactor biosynthesis A domain protein [Mycobacterium xenopi 3993]|nr:molybdenum cofactor biosynthesis A domain protein [Mycobacterium xenopi 3993]